MQPASNRLLTIIAICAALGLFLGRGLYRSATSEMRDFGAPYAGTRLFWAGENPYEDREISAALMRSGAASDQHSVAVYPPTTFLALAPFALAPATTAKALMLVCGLGLSAAGAWGWSRLLELDAKRWLVFSLMLACAPLHTALMTANPVLLSFGGLFFGTACVTANRKWPGAALLFWALLLKPQVGAVGLGWLALRGELRAASGIATTAMLVLGSLALWLSYHAPESFAAWLSNLQFETKEGTISALGALGMHRIDPGGLWAAVTHTALPWLVQLSLAGLFIALAGRRYWRSQDNRESVRSFAVLGVALLLSGYHRAYDALLLFPCWLLFAIPQTPRRAWTALFYISCGWVLPGPGFWTALAGQVPFVNSPLMHSAIWPWSVLRLHNWLLLFTAAIMLMARSQAAKPLPQPHGSPPRCDS